MFWDLGIHNTLGARRGGEEGRAWLKIGKRLFIKIPIPSQDFFCGFPNKTNKTTGLLSVHESKDMRAFSF